MRVLFLSTWFPFPPDNGSKIRAYYLLRALDAEHQVTVVSFCPHGNGGELGHFGSDTMQVHAVKADPYRHVRLPRIVKYAAPIPLAFWPSAALRRAVGQVAGMVQWDAVVAVQVPVAQYASQVQGACRILDVDTALSYQMHRRYAGQQRPSAYLRTWLSWKKAHHYERKMLRRFEVCTVASPVELSYVTALRGGKPATLIPNGVDCQHNRPGLVQPAPNSLVFNGALTYRANYDAMQYFLANIYPLIKEREPDVSLTITGSTTAVDLAGLRLDDSVRLSGYVDDVRPLIAGARACVVPIRYGGGTRLKILEAMALGTPVVATSKGAEGLDVLPGQNILVADEPADFAAQVLRLLRDVDLQQGLAVQARRLAEGMYDWQVIGQRFNDLVEWAAREKDAR
jgi:glycosyltransferase involved in cell wall biosynthesis